MSHLKAVKKTRKTTRQEDFKLTVQALVGMAVQNAFELNTEHIAQTARDYATAELKKQDERIAELEKKIMLANALAQENRESERNLRAGLSGWAGQLFKVLAVNGQEIGTPDCKRQPIERAKTNHGA